MTASGSTPAKGGKTVLLILVTLTSVLTVLFWTVGQGLQIQGLPRYFLQLGFYAVLMLLALWGVRRERFALPVSGRRILAAIGCAAAGWLVFVLVLHILGLVHWPEEIQTLTVTPAWKILAQIVSTWFFVGLGEEWLFRGYFLQAFRRHCAGGAERRRTILAVLLASAFFSLWHLPSRLVWLISGEIDLVLFIVSLTVLFLLGAGYAWLFLRSGNIFLTGLVHGVSDYPLVGGESQLNFVILLAAILCVEIWRFSAWKRGPAAAGALSSDAG